tara:strand:- start:454 stop:1056 length:603 start_codon:yes stop_codon:yes gene_type:complete
MIDSTLPNIWVGMGGIIALYVLLIGMLGWFVIGAKGKWWAKGTMIALSLWFGLTLFYTVHNFMGWPTLEQINKERSQILYFQIREPSKKYDDVGAIYLWVRILRSEEEPKGKTFQELMNPMTWFLYTDKRAPRAYKLPYTKEVHEQLEELTKNKQEKGSEGFIEKGEDEQGRPDGEQNVTSPIQIIVVDPSSLIPKDPGD